MARSVEPSRWRREFVSLLSVIWWYMCTYSLWLWAIAALLGYTNTAIVGLLCYGFCNTPKEGEEKVAIRGKETGDKRLRRHGSFSYDSTGRNAPRPASYFTNSRGANIYYRLMLPPNEAPVGLVFLIHGYSAHFNRPTYIPFLTELMDKGVAVATVDLEGHGYSDGIRCYLPSIDAVLDDLEQLVDMVKNGDAMVSSSDPYDVSENEHIASPEAQSKAHLVAQLPFFVGGQSLGGALALMLAQRLTSLQPQEF